MVSRSLDAGNSSMPPTANIISGKTSVCSRPWVEASRSASVPGSAAAWPANAVHAALEVALGEEQHAEQREHAGSAPQQKTAGPSTAMAPSAIDRAVRRGRRRARVEVEADDRRSPTNAATRPTSASTTWTT